ncbi:MAG: hypothetical protein P8Y84_05795 [Desulfuromonadales bacterium]|jgi:hypothetical protein
MSAHFYPTTTQAFLSLKKLILYAGLYAIAHITLAFVFALETQQTSATSTMNIGHFLLFPVEVFLVAACIVCAYLAIMELFAKLPDAIRSDYLSFRHRNSSSR